MNKKYFVLFLILISTNTLADRQRGIEETIGKYFKLRAYCPTEARVTIESLWPVYASHLDYKKIDPVIMLTDWEVKAKIEVCNIKVHYYLWLREIRGIYYRIYTFLPVSKIDEKYHL